MVMDVYSDLKILRKSAGLSETEASLYIGISRDDLRFYEEGSKLPDPDARESIIDFYSSMTNKFNASEIFPDASAQYIQLGDDAEDIPGDLSPETVQAGGIYASPSFKDAADYAFSVLDDRSRAVMTMYYGTDGDNKPTAEIAAQLGISKVRVNMIRRDAIETIKKSAKKEMLRQFL